MALPYTKGTLVWLSDPTSGWVAGTVSSVTVSDDGAPSSQVTLTAIYDANPSSVKVLKMPYAVLQTINAQTSIHPATPPAGQDALPPLRNPPKLATAEDLANLSNLNEPSVLHAIAMRYEAQCPYTYSGIVLLSMNPFTPLKIYDSTFVKLYSGQKKGQQEPHVFAIAEEALECMRRGEGTGGCDPTGAGDQTIVVSGESGAGKTVAAKYILRYFASAHDSRPEKSGSGRMGSGEEGMSETERQILASNPIMEAFGNAKTIRNDNSSRFGKYIEILFDNSNRIVGARVRTYLLERSRLVYQPELERNYHIFYQLLAGAPSKERKDLFLSATPLDFAYMAGGGASSTPILGVDDAQEFASTQAALSIVGISVERQWHIFKLLAALLHLGNVKISQARTDAVVSEDDPALALAADLLGLPAITFRKWIVKKQLTTRSEKIVTSLGSAQAMVVRDSVAKFVYSCLFDWLVRAVNDSLAGENGEGARKATKFIGVLDIYGFEHFKKNSFEQFCINWANEKLQQEFNAHVFKLEQEEYMREEITWKFIEFADNQACIDVIEGKMGILTLLDEESRLPSGADASFAAKLHQQLAKPEHRLVFKKPRFDQNAFTITHYAHDVTYSVEGFIDKNRDTVPDEQLALLQDSSNKFLTEVLDAALSVNTSQKVQATGGTGLGSKRPATRKPTLGSIFKASLINLMDTINQTNVHYIRCIKPNEAKNPWELDPQQVLSQLRACGVLETIRISCAGYPSRWEYEQFAERYHLMVDSKDWSKSTSIQDVCSLILRSTINDSSKYQLGLTKIFFRAGMLALLESLRSQCQYKLVTVIQKNIRRYLVYQQYKKSRGAAIRIQAWWRGVLTRQQIERMQRERFAVNLQAAVKGWLAQTHFRKTKQTLVMIQSAVRSHLAKNRAVELKRNSAAVLLQSLLRGCVTRQRYRAQITNVVLIQSQWRRKLASKELMALKMEAKSASKFKQISYQLENKVIALTQSLQRALKESKESAVQVVALQRDLERANSHSDEITSKNKELMDQLAVPSHSQVEFDQLLKHKIHTEALLQEAEKKVSQNEQLIEQLNGQLAVVAQALEEKSAIFDLVQAKNTELENTVGSLRAELQQTHEQIQRSNTLNALTKHSNPRQAPPSPTQANGLRSFENLANLGPFSDKTTTNTSRRRNRRHSTSGGPIGHFHSQIGTDMVSSRPLANPRAVSVMLQDGSAHPRNSNGLPLSPVNDNTTDEIIRLLEDEQVLEEDVIQGLIYRLKIPSPTLHNPPTAKEVLFPAHLISLISNEMWKQSMVPESERFLADIMQAIQGHVITFKGEEVIAPGIFWLSNVQEILSFICVAEDDASKGFAPGSEGGRDLDWDSYDRLISVVKHDLDSLEYNIYHTCMLEIKRKLAKMVVPALIESQSLPGFITSDGSGRMFSRMLSGMGGGNTQQTATMDDILSLLNKVWKCLKSYYMEESVMHQVVTELLKLIGQISFNDLIMRRNFCSWKRAMQIQYNITRIEEWCKSHEMPEGLLQLEHLMQATKLLQLKKATIGDIDILFDVCWILSPTQVQKLISQYHTADYEVPLNPEILRAVAARVRPEDKSDHLLLTPETDEVGPYQIPPPREIMGLETYVPAWLNVPSVRRLATFVA